MVVSEHLISNTAFTGTHYGDQFGSAVGFLGDIDADGIDDIAVGAWYDNNVGSAWVLRMNANNSVKGYQEITNSTGGLGENLDPGDDFGVALAAIGDLDGDNVTELVVGAFGDDDGCDNCGAVYVLFLQSNGTVKSYQKISQASGGLDSSLLTGDHLGVSVAALGDADDDGVPDMAVGAASEGGGRRGVWVLFLKADGAVREFNVFGHERGGFTGSLGAVDAFAWSLYCLGDLDGDGDDIDLAVGVRNDGNDGYGAIWIVFMNMNGTVKGQQKISATEGGFTGTLFGADLFGYSVTSLGDINGDGTTDVGTGATYDDAGSPVGAFWVLFSPA